MKHDIVSILFEKDGSSFRAEATKVTCIAITLLMIPGSVLNFRNGTPVVGMIAVFVALVSAFLAWRLNRDRLFLYSAQLILGPSVIVALWFAFSFHGALAAVWIYPAITLYFLMLNYRKAAIANAVLLLMVVFMFSGKVDFQVFVRIISAMVLMNVFMVSFIVIIEKQQAQIKTAAMTDPLTGLLNRMTLDRALDDAIHLNQRNNTPMSLLAVDLDHFKRINDEHGHDVGDQVLRNFAKLMESKFRQTDRIFRNGGEEFLVLLFDTGGSGAAIVAENLLGDIRSFDGLITTASIGVAEYIKNEHREHWIKRADENMYEAKRTGRNRVVSTLP